MTRFSKTFGPKASWVAFDAFGDLLFVNREDATKRLKKSRQKMPLSCAEGLGTAQIAFVAEQHEPACQGNCNKDVGCEMDLRAVPDGFR